MDLHRRVQQALQSSGVPYRLRRHDRQPRAIRSPADMAEALGYPVARITKSLLVRTSDGRTDHAVAVLSAGDRADWSRLAAALSARRVEMAPREDLENVLDYPPQGVSPIGADRLPVVLERRLLGFETVLVGAGVAGVEVEMDTADLQRITAAVVADFALDA